MQFYKITLKLPYYYYCLSLYQVKGVRVCNKYMVIPNEKSKIDHETIIYNNPDGLN